MNRGYDRGMATITIRTGPDGIRLGKQGIERDQAQRLLSNVRDELPFDVILGLVLWHIKKTGGTLEDFDEATLHFTPGAGNGVILRVEAP